MTFPAHGRWPDPAAAPQTMPTARWHGWFDLVTQLQLLPALTIGTLLGPELMFARHDKHYPINSWHNSLATAVTNFTKPVTKGQSFFKECLLLLRILYESPRFLRTANQMRDE